jgi:hypothetical protein
MACAHDLAAERTIPHRPRKTSRGLSNTHQIFTAGAQGISGIACALTGRGALGRASIRVGSSSTTGPCHAARQGEGIVARTLNRLIVAAAGTLMVVIGLQVVPYGRSHVNPPVLAEPEWDATSTRDLAKRACFDCHSNETQWPAYAHVAPMSWLIVRDVREGRQALNFSEWSRPQKEAGEAAEVVANGEMPLFGYRLMHRGARLTPVEREQLERGLARTLGMAHSVDSGCDRYFGAGVGVL